MARRPTRTIGVRTVRLLLAWTALAWSMLAAAAAKRCAALRAEPERGSISVEKAVITAISLGLALALMAAITAVVNKYTGMIK